MVIKFLPTISPLRSEDEFPDRVFDQWDVIVICFLVGHGEGQEHIARQYAVNVQTIHRLVNRVSYRSWNRQDGQLEDLYTTAMKTMANPGRDLIVDPKLITERLKLELAYRVLRLWRDETRFQKPASSVQSVGPQQ